MRLSVLTVAAVIGLMMLPNAVRAAPVIGGDQSAASSAPIVEVRGGCGPGFHPAWWRDRWGRPHRRCVPNRGW
jgi:hypothetical protein